MFKNHVIVLKTYADLFHNAKIITKYSCVWHIWHSSLIYHDIMLQRVSWWQYTINLSWHHVSVTFGSMSGSMYYYNSLMSNVFLSSQDSNGVSFNSMTSMADVWSVSHSNKIVCNQRVTTIFVGNFHITHYHYSVSLSLLTITTHHYSSSLHIITTHHHYTHHRFC